MYFALAYEMWPRLTGRPAPSLKLQRRQLWLWAVGMMVMTLPWHWLGLNGQWRRVAHFDYNDPVIAWWAPWVVLSVLGGFILLASAFLLIWNPAAFHGRARPPQIDGVLSPRPMRYAVAVHQPARVPAALNGFGLWNVLLLVLMVAAYAYPIAQFFIIDALQAVVHRVDRAG